MEEGCSKLNEPEKVKKTLAQGFAGLINASLCLKAIRAFSNIEECSQILLKKQRRSKCY